MEKMVRYYAKYTSDESIERSGRKEEKTSSKTRWEIASL